MTKQKEVPNMARRIYEVVSYDNKYYWTDGVEECVLNTTTSEKDAKRLVRMYKAQATPTPWTGFYWREKTVTKYYVEFGYGFSDLFGFTCDEDQYLKTRCRDDFRGARKMIFGMDGRLIKEFDV